MKYMYSILTMAIILCISCTNKEKADNLDYRIVDGKFETSEGVIPEGCFGQLMTELNGDNTVAAIFINRASLRGCIDANSPYPRGNEEDISYVINEKLQNHIFRITVTQIVHGSMSSFSERIIVAFVDRTYVLEDKTMKKVLSLEKVGKW